MACVATLGCDGAALPNPASIVGLALHASRAFGQPQLTPVCSLAVSNVRPGRAVPPTAMLYASGGLSDGREARVRLVPPVSFGVAFLRCFYSLH